MSDARWSIEKINAWYQKLPWLVGCTFIPSTAINQLEMWQADTFDMKTIQRELGWAERLRAERRARLPARPGLAAGSRRIQKRIDRVPGRSQEEAHPDHPGAFSTTAGIPTRR